MQRPRQFLTEFKLCYEGITTTALNQGKLDLLHVKPMIKGAT